MQIVLLAVVKTTKYEEPVYLLVWLVACAAIPGNYVLVVLHVQYFKLAKHSRLTPVSPENV